jgi:hypothetical protein
MNPQTCRPFYDHFSDQFLAVIGTFLAAMSAKNDCSCSARFCHRFATMAPYHHDKKFLSRGTKKVKMILQKMR